MLFVDILFRTWREFEYEEEWIHNMHKAGKMMAVVTKKGADLVLIPQFGSLELRTNCESTTRTTTRKSLPVIDDVSSGYNG